MGESGPRVDSPNGPRSKGNTMGAEICCHPECREKVSKGHIACVAHWHSVDVKIRRQVQWRLNGWKDKTAAIEYLNYFFRKQMKG